MTDRIDIPGQTLDALPPLGAEVEIGDVHYRIVDHYQPVLHDDEGRPYRGYPFATGERVATKTVFTRAELLADPEAFARAAEETGHAVVLGDDGRPRLTLSVLQEDLPALGDESVSNHRGSGGGDE